MNYKWILALFLALTTSGMVFADSSLLMGSKFLENAFGTVNIIPFYDRVRTELDAYDGFSWMFLFESRSVHNRFAVRSTDAYGNPLLGQAASGVIDGSAAQYRLAFSLGMSFAKQAVQLKTAFLLDGIGASHRSGVLDMLAHNELLEFGGKTGFSAFAMTWGLAFELTIMRDFSAIYIPFFKQHSSYDNSGKFITAFVPEYSGIYTMNQTGSKDKSGENSIGISTDSNYMGAFPGDIHPAVQLKDQFASVRLFKVELTGLFNGDVGPAVLGLARHFLVSKELLDIPFLEFLRPFYGIYNNLEYLNEAYNFFRTNKTFTYNLGMSMPFLGESRELPNLMKGTLEIALWEPAFHYAKLEFSIGNYAPHYFENQPSSLPFYLCLGLDVLNTQEFGILGGFKAVIGWDLGLWSTEGEGATGVLYKGMNSAMEFGISYNDVEEMKSLVSSPNEFLFTLNFKIKSN